MIRALLRRIRERKARKMLNVLVQQTRASYETQDFIRRRSAALKGERRDRFLSAIGKR